MTYSALLAPVRTRHLLLSSPAAYLQAIDWPGLPSYNLIHVFKLLKVVWLVAALGGHLDAEGSDHLQVTPPFVGGLLDLNMKDQRTCTDERRITT